jgi:ABC-type sugar transport system ATPase subunit
MISSELNELLAMTDRILVMHEGRLTGQFQGPDYVPASIAAAAAGVTP